MGSWKGLAARARSILRPGDAEARLDEEFRFHLETETEHLIREGVPPAERGGGRCSHSARSRVIARRCATNVGALVR